MEVVLLEDSYVLKNTVFMDGKIKDIVIENGKIKEITSGGSGTGKIIIDCTGLFVSSGWIDLHVHAFPDFAPYGDELDEIGIKQGVATVVDAGSCGADDFEKLLQYSESSKTNLLAFLNVSEIGLQRVDELSNLEWINREKLLATISAHPKYIVGLKARISKSVVGENGVQPLQIAQQLSKETSLPVMVHIGSGPPNIDEIGSLLKEDDIITHYLNGKRNNLFHENGKPLHVLIEAINRGVQLDVGHGSASFSFEVAEAAKKYNIPLGTISSDIYRGNRLHGPVFSLAHVLSKFLYLGYSLQEVINAVTYNAAKWLKRPELGRIQVGDVANLTLFTIERNPTSLVDSEGEQRIAKEMIKAKGVVANGEFIECKVWSKASH